jgi:hypothetical protein
MGHVAAVTRYASLFYGCLWRLFMGEIMQSVQLITGLASIGLLPLQYASYPSNGLYALSEHRANKVFRAVSGELGIDVAMMAFPGPLNFVLSPLRLFVCSRSLSHTYGHCMCT